MDTSSIPLKRCCRCKLWFPATTEHFYRCKSHKDGLSKRCRSCDKITADISRKRHIEESRATAREYQRIKRREFTEEDKVARRQYRKNHRVQENTYKRTYRHNNPEQIQAEQRRRVARRKGADGTFTTEDVAVQYRSQKGKCWWCGKKLNGKYHIDHRIPISKDGTNWANNIVLACATCNCSKKDHLPSEWNGRLL